MKPATQDKVDKALANDFTCLVDVIEYRPLPGCRLSASDIESRATEAVMIDNFLRTPKTERMNIKIGIMDAHSDSLLAALASTLLHLTLFALILARQEDGASLGRISSVPARSTLTLSAASAENEFRQKIVVAPKTNPTFTETTKPSQETLDDSRTYKPELTQPTETSPNQHRFAVDEYSSESQEVEYNDHQEATDETSAESGDSHETVRNELHSRYVAAIRAAILAKWGNNSKSIDGCAIVITQQPGGMVDSAKIEGCAVEPGVRFGLEAAALMAQPVPYDGFESVFSASLEIKLSGGN